MKRHLPSPATQSRRRIDGPVLVFLLLCFLAVPGSRAAAQSATPTATLAGQVRDAAGAALPGARITLRHLATNQTRRTVSEADGAYRLTALPVGDYELRIEAAGFASYLNPMITLVLGQAAALDATLQPGGVSAEVTVTERPPAIDPSSTAVTTSIDPERIAELPINSRNYLEFTLLAPGVAPSGSQANIGARGLAGSPLGDSGFTFGGLRARSNAIVIDGLDNTDETTGAARVALSPEIVREFQIVNSGSSAEGGGAAGGTINVVTRTGSNDFHGGGFFFLQNEAFNARGPLLAAADPTPRFRRSQFGGSLGGPLLRDRLFFYTALEGEHFTGQEESEIDSQTRARVNAALRAGLAPRLPVRALTNALAPIGQEETEIAGKLTYLPNARHTVHLRYAFSNDRARGDAFGGDALTDASARGSAYTKDHQITGSAVSLLSDRWINELRFQESTRRVTTRPVSVEGPEIDIAGLARVGRPWDADAGRRETRTQLVENLAFVRPRSEWKAGVTINRVSLASHLREGFAGLFVFRSLDEFAAGRPALWRQAFGAADTGFPVTSLGAFVQNQWRARPDLSLNLGVRYDTERLPALFQPTRNNLSPRLGLAWNPSSAWVVRAGFGLFYDRFPLAYLNRALQQDGARAFEQIAFGGDAARAFAGASAGEGGGTATAPLAGIAPSIVRPAARFDTPYSAQANVGIERLLAPNLTLRAEYLFTHGIHLPRTRNSNLPAPTLLTPANAASLGVSSPTPQELGRAIFSPQRLDAHYDAIYLLENAASSAYHGLTVSLNQRLSHDLQFLAAYTYAKTLDTASDFDEQPESPANLRAERALSQNHVGQRLVVNAIVELFGDEEAARPAGAKKKEPLETIFGNLELLPIVTLSSGHPVNPLTGVDENRSGAFPLSARPLGIARNSLSTPRFVNFDVRIVKYIPLGGFTPYSTSGTRRIDFVVEFFNLFNHPNVVALNPVYGSGATPLPGYGRPTAFARPRQTRFSIDFEF